MDFRERIDNARRVLGEFTVARKSTARHGRKIPSVLPKIRKSVSKSEYYSCRRKVRYRTQGEATKHMHVLTALRPQTRLRCYLCEYCGYYHMTSKP